MDSESDDEVETPTMLESQETIEEQGDNTVYCQPLHVTLSMHLIIFVTGFMETVSNCTLEVMR